MEVDLKKTKSEYKFMCEDIEIAKRLISLKLIQDKMFFVVKDNMIILNKIVIILFTREQAIRMFFENEKQQEEQYKNLGNSIEVLNSSYKEDKSKIKYKRYNDSNAVNQKLKQSTLLSRKRVIKYD